ATPTDLRTHTARPPAGASATRAPVPTAAASAQLRLLPRKPRAATRSTCRDRFIVLLLSERINLLADTTSLAAATLTRPGPPSVQIGRASSRESVSRPGVRRRANSTHK